MDTTEQLTNNNNAKDCEEARSADNGDRLWAQSATLPSGPSRDTGVDPLPGCPGWTPVSCQGGRTLSLPWRHRWSLRLWTNKDGCA